jgi:hypothetical protein
LFKLFWNIIIKNKFLKIKKYYFNTYLTKNTWKNFYHRLLVANASINEVKATDRSGRAFDRRGTREGFTSLSEAITGQWWQQMVFLPPRSHSTFGLLSGSGSIPNGLY